jgi:hypothetical protein
MTKRTLLRRLGAFLLLAAAVAAIWAVLLGFRQPGLLLDFLSLRYCG